LGVRPAQAAMCLDRANYLIIADLVLSCYRAPRAPRGFPPLRFLLALPSPWTLTFLDFRPLPPLRLAPLRFLPFLLPPPNISPRIPTEHLPFLRSLADRYKSADKIRAPHLWHRCQRERSTNASLSHALALVEVNITISPLGSQWLYDCDLHATPYFYPYLVVSSSNPPVLP